VIHLTEHEDARHRLEDLRIKTLAVNHSRVKGILQSITTIGDHCGAQKEGKNLRHLLESRVREIQEILVSISPNPPVNPSENNISNISASPRPRVIVTVGRSLQAGETGEIYVSGRDGFYDDLISLAGGENAYREETLKFPALSAEGLASMDPDVIIEMIPDLQSLDDLNELMSYWENLPGLSAVREGRVHILGGDYVVVPGPRYIRLLEEMAELIHGMKLENGE
jgi:iron complex transport system substrate-binding protein